MYVLGLVCTSYVHVETGKFNDIIHFPQEWSKNIPTQDTHIHSFVLTHCFLQESYCARLGQMLNNGLYTHYSSLWRDTHYSSLGTPTTTHYGGIHITTHSGGTHKEQLTKGLNHSTGIHTLVKSNLVLQNLSITPLWRQLVHPVKYYQLGLEWGNLKLLLHVPEGEGIT